MLKAAGGLLLARVPQGMDMALMLETQVGNSPSSPMQTGMTAPGQTRLPWPRSPHNHPAERPILIESLREGRDFQSSSELLLLCSRLKTNRDLLSGQQIKVIIRALNVEISKR